MKGLQSIDVLVLTLMKANQYQRVKDLLHKYTIIQPDNSQVFCLMAQILQETRDTDQAKSWFVICRVNCRLKTTSVINAGICKP